MMTLEEFKKTKEFQDFQKFQKFQELGEEMKEAQTDDTPYLAVDSDTDELHIIGDPNKTEIKSADYTVYFLFPDTKQFRERVKNSDAHETDEINGRPIEGEIPHGYFLARRDFNGVYITPRRVGNALTAFAMVEGFYYDVTEDGELRDLSYEEALAVFQNASKEMFDATYDVVSAVLNIPVIEQEYMLPINVIENAIKIVGNNPDVVNAADLFFGSMPSEER